LGNTFEDLSHVSIFVLIRAVGDDDINTKSTSKILDSLCFTCSGWSSWGSTIVHTESLSKSDVAFICKTSNAKSFFSTEELISIDESNVSNANIDLSRFGVPVDSCVLLPLKVILVLDLVEFAQILDLEEDISLMDMNSNKCLSLLSDKFVHVFKTHVGKSFHDSKDISLFLLELLELFFIIFLKALLNFIGPKSLDTEKGNLGLVSITEFFKWHGEAVLATSLTN